MTVPKSQQKKEITTKGFKIPKGKRTKAGDVTLLTKPVSECDGILQPVIEEVAATIEGSNKRETALGGPRPVMWHQQQSWRVACLIVLNSQQMERWWL